YSYEAELASVRKVNETGQEVSAAAPRDVHARARRHGRPEESGAIALRLPYRAPCDAAGLIAFLGARAVAGVEELRDGAYRRSMRLPNGQGTVQLRAAGDHVEACFWLADLRDLGPALQRCRSLLDLDADPQSVV